MKTEGLARQVLREMMDLCHGPGQRRGKAGLPGPGRSGPDRRAGSAVPDGVQARSNGAVEVKLTDRVAVLEKLLEQQKAEEDGLGGLPGGHGPAGGPGGMCSQR